MRSKLGPLLARKGDTCVTRRDAKVNSSTRRGAVSPGREIGCRMLRMSELRRVCMKAVAATQVRSHLNRAAEKVLVKITPTANSPSVQLPILMALN